MKALYRWMLRSLARRVLQTYKPAVVAIAGSIGKTATKDAIAAAVSINRRVRKTEGNFNAEVGVPVTIIAGGQARHGLAWLAVPLIGLRTLWSRTPYPEVLVLELGTDKPGDLAPLLQLVQPKIGVLTAIAPEHLEFFGDLDGVAEEEASVLRMLGPNGTGIVNADDALAVSRASGISPRVIRYGWSESAEVKAEHADITTDEHGRPTGQVVKVRAAGGTVPIKQPGIIGKHQAYPVLAAVSVAVALNIPISQAVEGLQRFVPPPGRMRVLVGLKGSTLIDDSYNASPQAMAAALQTLTELRVPGKRIAILGQMSELGTAAVTWHTWVGERMTSAGCDVLVTIGPLAEHIGRAAAEHGFPAERIRNVPNAEAAAAEIQAELGPNDVILLKGSRYAARLEHAAKLLLAFPERDAELLVDSE